MQPFGHCETLLTALNHEAETCPNRTSNKLDRFKNDHGQQISDYDPEAAACCVVGLSLAPADRHLGLLWTEGRLC